MKKVDSKAIGEVKKKFGRGRPLGTKNVKANTKTGFHRGKSRRDLSGILVWIY